MNTAVVEPAVELANEVERTLRLDDSMRTQLTVGERAMAVANGYVIDSHEMADEANGELRRLVVAGKKIEELRDGFVAPARQIIENARNLFSPARDSIAAGIAALKGKLQAWQQLCDQRQAEEKRRLDEEARLVRQEAERKAVIAKATADEREREARQKAEQAAQEQRRAAEAAEAARKAGDAKAAAVAEAQARAAAKLRAEQEELERKIREDAEVKAGGERLAAEAQAQALEASKPQAVAAPAGFSTRKNWTVELAPGVTDEQAKVLIVEAIASGRKELLSLVTLDLKAAAKLAKALEANFNVPGMRARNSPIAATRAA